MKSLGEHISQVKTLHSLNEFIAESKALHQNVNISERLLINKDFKIYDEIDTLIDKHINYHADDIDEDEFTDIDKLVSLICYSLWGPNNGRMSGYSTAKVAIHNYISDEEDMLSDESLLYSSSEMSLKELDKYFDKIKGTWFRPPCGIIFYIKFLVTNNFMVIRYDNSERITNDIHDAVIKF